MMSSQAPQNILAVVDPTAEHQVGLEKAARLAHYWDSTLHIVLFDAQDHHYRLSPDAARRRVAVVADPDRWLDGLRAPLKAAGLHVFHSFEHGRDLEDLIVQYAENADADLIVKDTHPHGILRRSILGNVDWQIVRNSRSPVLLAKPAPWRSPPRLGAAVAPGHLADPDNQVDLAILGVASAWARALHGHLGVFHAYFPAGLAACVEARAPLPFPPGHLEADYQAHFRDVAYLASTQKIEENAVHVVMGVPTEYLPQAASDERLDIMVIGALSRSHLKQWVLGSTVERTLEYLPCDVLTVRNL